MSISPLHKQVLMSETYREYPPNVQPVVQQFQTEKEKAKTEREEKAGQGEWFWGDSEQNDVVEITYHNTLPSIPDRPLTPFERCCVQSGIKRG